MLTDIQITNLSDYLDKSQELIKAQGELIEAKGRLITSLELQIEILKEIVRIHELKGKHD